MSERIKNIIVQGSIPEFEHDGDDLDKYYIPVRGLQVALGQKNSLVVLPDSWQIREFIDQSADILSEIGVMNPESILVPDTNYFLDKALETSLELLEDRVNKSERHILWPYSNTEVSDGWLESFRRKGFLIENALPRKEYKSHQTRSAWGRRITSPDAPSFPERSGIPYPISYIATGESQLLEAYQRVSFHSDNDVAYLKLSASAGGFGVARVENEEEVKLFYEMAKRDGVLYLFGDEGKEQDIEVQEEIENIVGFGSIQYLGERLQTPGGVSIQLLKGNNWVGNKFNVLNGGLDVRGAEIFERFSRGMHTEHPEDTKGWGGIDLAIIQHENGPLDLIVVENNWGRITGAHPGIYFANALGVSDRPFLVRKLTPPRVDAEECWQMLKSENISFDPVSQRGAIPFPWVRGVDAFIFVAGEDDTDIIRMADEVANLSAKNGYH